MSPLYQSLWVDQVLLDVLCLLLLHHPKLLVDDSEPVLLPQVYYPDSGHDLDTCEVADLSVGVPLGSRLRQRTISEEHHICLQVCGDVLPQFGMPRLSRLLLLLW